MSETTVRISSGLPAVTSYVALEEGVVISGIAALMFMPCDTALTMPAFVIASPSTYGVRMTWCPVPRVWSSLLRA